MSSKWNAQLTEEEYEAIMSFDWVDKTQLNDEEYVIEAFKEISKRIRAVPNLYYTLEDLFFATEYLLDAYERKDFRWEQLAVILRHKVDYGALFEINGETLSSIVNETTALPTPSDKYDRREYLEALHPFLTVGFVEAMDALTEPYLPKLKVSKGKTSAQLLGKTPIESWTDFLRGDVLDYSKEKPHQHGAQVFESELLANRKFQRELKRLLSELPKGSKDWQFSQLQDEWPNPVGHLIQVDADKRTYESPSSRYETRNIPAELKFTFDCFFWRWCLRSISDKTGSSYYHELNVFITAKRMSVQALTPTGVEVFIPRYYSFRDISHRKCADFQPLAVALDEHFTHIRLQKSRAALEREANDHLKLLLKQGMTDLLQRWEATRDYFNWGDDSMEDYTFPKPKRPKDSRRK